LEFDNSGYVFYLSIRLNVQTRLPFIKYTVMVKTLKTKEDFIGMSPTNKDEENQGSHESVQSNKSSILSGYDIQSIDLWISKMKQNWFRTIRQKSEKAKSTLQLPYTIIGGGTNRIVYDLNNGNVLKVAISNWGLQCNKTEFEIYTHCPNDLRKHLCPVKESGNGWIIMDKMDRKVPFDIHYLTKIPELEMKFLMAGIIPMDMKKRANLALTKENEIIVIDYGLFIKALTNFFS
jgi:hypothetical protein